LIILKSILNDLAGHSNAPQKEGADPDNGVVPIEPDLLYYPQPIAQMAYCRIPLQPVPDNAEMRNGVYVYRPYMLCDFFGAVELYGEDEVNYFEEADEETRAFFGLYNLQEKYWFGFEEDYFLGCSVWCGVTDQIITHASSTLATTTRFIFALRGCKRTNDMKQINTTPTIILK